MTNVYAEQVLIAIGEGAKAALSAYDYLLTQPHRRASARRQRVALIRHQRINESAIKRISEELIRFFHHLA